MTTKAKRKSDLDFLTTVLLEDPDDQTPLGIDKVTSTKRGIQLDLVSKDGSRRWRHTVTTTELP